MGTIQARRRKDGAAGFTASIRIKQKGKVIHSETETFNRKQLAQEWMRRREAELDQLRARGQLTTSKYTLGDLVKWYRDTVVPTAEWGRTKAFDLERIQRYEIAKRYAHTLTAADYVEHVVARRAEGAGPATAGNNLIWFGQVIRSARPSLGVHARLDALADARHELISRRLIGKSRWRDRRLTKDEDRRLQEYFATPDVRAVIPMLDIYHFALASARRQEEITRLRRPDLDRANSVAWLNDVKHPTQKKGNRMKFRVLESAWEIIERQPSGEFVFRMTRSRSGRHLHVPARCSASKT